MNDQLITLLTNYNAPLTLLFFLYLFFKLNKLENTINKIEGKLCVILTLINNQDGTKKK